MNRLDVLSRHGQAAGQFTAAIRCEELLGKHCGLIVEIEAAWDGNPESMTPEQRAKVKKVLEKIVAEEEQQPAPDDQLAKPEPETVQ